MAPAASRPWCCEAQSCTLRSFALSSKLAVRAEVVPSAPSAGLPQVARRVRVVRLVGLLRVESGAGQVAVQQAGRDGVGSRVPAVDCAHPVLAPAGVVGGVHDGPGGDLGLVDRRNRLGVPAAAGTAPR